jgi:LmbE family N-acetylglucosaminyl deacetylase
VGTHLFLSPHLDDAILSCGGVIHRLARAGQRVIIVTVMAGEPSDALPDSPVLQAIRTQWESGRNTFRERRAEDAQAALQLRAQVYHLALLESAFRQTLCGAGDWIALYPEHDSPFTINEADDARLTLFETRLPFVEVVTIYAPMGIDNHVDHQLVRDWALVLTGPAHAPALKFYEEYPHARNRSSLQRAQAYYHQTMPALKMESEITLLTSDDCAAKLRAMGCYRSHLHVLWNDMAEMEQQARDYMTILGDGTPAERYWRVVRA